MVKHNLVISAISFSTSSSSSLSIWCTVLNAKLFFDFSCSSCFCNDFTSHNDLMSSFNESLVRSLASRISVTFTSYIFGKDLRIFLMISALLQVLQRASKLVVIVVILVNILIMDSFGSILNNSYWCTNMLIFFINLPDSFLHVLSLIHIIYL
jgi:hypothetical protein